MRVPCSINVKDLFLQSDGAAGSNELPRGIEDCDHDHIVFVPKRMQRRRRAIPSCQRGANRRGREKARWNLTSAQAGRMVTDTLNRRTTCDPRKRARMTGTMLSDFPLNREEPFNFHSGRSDGAWCGPDC